MERGESIAFIISVSRILPDISDLNVTLSKNTAGLTHHSRKHHLLANLYI